MVLALRLRITGSILMNTAVSPPGGGHAPALRPRDDPGRRRRGRRGAQPDHPARDDGAGAGVPRYVLVLSVKPGFGGQAFIPKTTEKSRRLKEMTDLPIAVDGGITVETAPLVEAGARVLVAGSTVYKGDPATEMRG